MVAFSGVFMTSIVVVRRCFFTKEQSISFSCLPWSSRSFVFSWAPLCFDFKNVPNCGFRFCIWNHKTGMMLLGHMRPKQSCVVILYQQHVWGNQQHVSTDTQLQLLSMVVVLGWFEVVLQQHELRTWHSSNQPRTPLYPSAFYRQIWSCLSDS